MKTKSLLFVLLISNMSLAQVGIGTITPQGELDIVTTSDMGIVIPRVSNINNVTDGQGNPPANGTLVYDLSKNAMCFYQNEKWACIEFNNDGSVSVANNTIYYNSQNTYIKASNNPNSEFFGISITLSADGNTLAVGAIRENSNATGINGNEFDNSAPSSGAVYVFTRASGTWSQQAYIKASNTESTDGFGRSIALSIDGNTLAVGASDEDSNSTGINGDQTDNSASKAGAVYVFTRTSDTWSQQAYVKASNTDINDSFGSNLALSGDGNTLAVGASDEDSNSTGINGDQTDNSASRAGAVYVFSRVSGIWSQQAYIKASNTDSNDIFGISISINVDGNTLAVGAYFERSNATGIDGNQADNSASGAGAVYVFTRAGSVWLQQAYVKASNTESSDIFGNSIALSADGNTLAVSAANEDSNAIGIDGDQADNSASSAGAVYVFTRSGVIWSQQVYIKASNTEANDGFGDKVAISGDGTTLAVSATDEDSSTSGVNWDQTDNSSSSSGAVYIFSFIDNTWALKSFIKSTNTESSDIFGDTLAINENGNTIVAGTFREDSNASGINGDQTDNSQSNAGAVYIYEN